MFFCGQAQAQKSCKCGLLNPAALLRHLLGALPSCQRRFASQKEYITQEPDCCLPSNYTRENVLIPLVVYFGGAGVVGPLGKVNVALGRAVC